jgi:hypothetical protein
VTAHPGLELIRLTDDQAAFVRGKGVEIVDSPLVA